MKVKVEERIIAPKEVIVGDPDAKVLIVEYGDYESSETAKTYEVVRQLLETYKGKVKYNFRHFPLTKYISAHLRQQRLPLGQPRKENFGRCMKYCCNISAAWEPLA